MKYKNILQEINDCITFLIGKSIIHDQNYAHISAETSCYRITSCTSPSVLSFSNIDDYNIICDELRKNRQFTVLMFDNTMINLEYQFKNDCIYKLRCLVLPDLRLYAGDEYYQDYSNSELNIELEFLQKYQLKFPFRIDYDISASKPGSHPKSHVHLGFSEGCRIPISVPLTPKIIFKFIIENFYNPTYIELKNEFDNFFILNQSNTFPKDIDILDKKKLFLDIDFT